MTKNKIQNCNTSENSTNKYCYYTLQDHVESSCVSEFTTTYFKIFQVTKSDTNISKKCIRYDMRSDREGGHFSFAV